MKLMFIGAHPDDIEWGCAGTILRAIAEGYKVSMVVLTDGEKAEASEGRADEQKEACKLLGASLTRLGLPDGQICRDASLIRSLKELIAKENPNAIFTHYSDDTHQDHVNTAAAVVAASKGRNLLFYRSYSSVGFAPTLFVDVEEYSCKKEEVLNKHESQIVKYINRGEDFIKRSYYIEKADGLNIAGGKRIEGFTLHRAIF